MQPQNIVKTFKSYPCMPQKLQLRLLSHVANQGKTTPEQIEAKLLKAQMLKEQQEKERLAKNARHLHMVATAHIRAIDKKTAMINL